MQVITDIRDNHLYLQVLDIYGVCIHEHSYASGFPRQTLKLIEVGLRHCGAKQMDLWFQEAPSNHAAYEAFLRQKIPVHVLQHYGLSL